MEIVIDKEYPNDQAAEVDESINSDLVDTRDPEDVPCT